MMLASQPLPVTARPWKSTHTSKASWDEHLVRAVAAKLHATMPNEVVALITSGAFRGGPLVNMTLAPFEPTVQDIANNRLWVEPYVEKFKTKVPSAFFIADTLLLEDETLKGSLLKPLPPPPGEEADIKSVPTKIQLALDEASRIKRLISHLRSLWRSSSNSDLPDVQELKSLMKPRTADNVSPPPAALPLPAPPTPAPAPTPTCSDELTPEFRKACHMELPPVLTEVLHCDPALLQDLWRQADFDMDSVAHTIESNHAFKKLVEEHLGVPLMALRHRQR